MLAQARTRPRRKLSHPALLVLPLVLLLAAAALANFGLVGADRADAVTNTVVVNATVSSNLSVTPCAGPVAISVVTGTLSTGTCGVNFGATNQSARPLQIRDNDGAAPFLAGAGSLPNKAADCLTMAADGVGWKIDSVGITATHNPVNGCGTGTAVTTTNYTAMPAALTTVCTTSAAALQDCPIHVGVLDVAPATTAGVYTGTIQFSVA